MFNHLAVCFDLTAVNDPSKTDSAFAGGPFMLSSRNYVISLSSAVVGIRYFAGKRGLRRNSGNQQSAISNYQLPIANYLVNYLFIRNRNLAALQFAPLGCRDF